jgi:hypothetical protein
VLGPGAIADLPLLQVPGHTVLPGVIQVMLISGPEWVHCFSELQALATEEAQPARFGHLQAYENIGVLMELREVRPLANGRLVVVARAIANLLARQPAMGFAPMARLWVLPPWPLRLIACPRARIAKGGAPMARLWALPPWSPRVIVIASAL